MTMFPLFCTSWLAEWALLLSPSLTCLEDLLSPFLHLVQSPLRIFTLGESLPEVLLSFLEQLRIAAHGEGPAGEGLDNTEFG